MDFSDICYKIILIVLFNYTLYYVFNNNLYNFIILFQFIGLLSPLRFFL